MTDITERLNQWTLESLEDESSGDVESPTGWFALFIFDAPLDPIQVGGYILRIDNDSFKHHEYYPDATEARERFYTLEDEYDNWLSS